MAGLNRARSFLMIHSRKQWLENQNGKPSGSTGHRWLYDGLIDKNVLFDRESIGKSLLCVNRNNPERSVYIFCQCQFSAMFVKARLLALFFYSSSHTIHHNTSNL
jgi:hypothetical protein